MASGPGSSPEPGTALSPAGGGAPQPVTPARERLAGRLSTPWPRRCAVLVVAGLAGKVLRLGPRPGSA
jgi:hypothetical protein